MPCMVCEVALCHIIEVRAETEIVDQGGASLDIIRAAFRGPIPHIHRHPAMVHQLSHGINLLRGAACGKYVRHARVVIIGAVVVHFQRAILAVVAVCAATVQWITPIINDLRHCCRYATSQNVPVRTVFIFRTHRIVVPPLVPLRCQQRPHSTATSRTHRLARLQPRPFGGGLRFGRDVLFHHRLDLLFVAAEPAAHVVGHVRHHEVVVVGVAQDRLHAVVGSHNHKPFGLQGEDVVAVGGDSGEAVVGLSGID